MLVLCQDSKIFWKKHDWKPVHTLSVCSILGKLFILKETVVREGQTESLQQTVLCASLDINKFFIKLYTCRRELLCITAFSTEQAEMDIRVDGTAAFPFNIRHSGTSSPAVRLLWHEKSWGEVSSCKEQRKTWLLKKIWGFSVKYI